MHALLFCNACVKALINTVCHVLKTWTQISSAAV